MKNKLNIGLIGFGCVGEGLYDVLNQSALIDAEITRIVVKNREKKRSLPSDKFGFDVNEILDDAAINVVVELINDSEEAYSFVRLALGAGKHVVSANKKLIAEHLNELIELAELNEVSFLYEAAVAGSIPIIRNLEEYYNNDSLTSLEGILNGTTNYILTKANEGLAYTNALKNAQELGFAELNPTLDVDGFDSKYKLTILLKHGFGIDVNPNAIFNSGIRNISAQAIAYAKEKGYRIKLFSRAEKIEDKIAGFVAPHFIKNDHFAFNVDNEFNAVVVEGLFSDKQLFIGKGAGSHPTASAVLSDISALKFDYKYEYRRSSRGQEIEYTEEFFVKIYLESKYVDAINEVPFYRVDELFQSDTLNYQTGWVLFSDLSRFDFNNLPDLSMIILPDVLRIGSEFKRESIAQNFLELEAIQIL